MSRLKLRRWCECGMMRNRSPIIEPPSRAIGYFVLCCLLCQTPAAATQVGRGAATNPAATPASIQYGQLAETLQDWTKRKPGEQIAVVDVPLITKITPYPKSSPAIYRRFHYLQTEAENGVAFTTSSEMAKSLRSHLPSGAKEVRVHCTVIETDEGDYGYLIPFATRVEGLDEKGAVLWEARGTPPPRLKYQT